MGKKGLKRETLFSYVAFYKTHGLWFTTDPGLPRKKLSSSLPKFHFELEASIIPYFCN